MNGDNGNLLSSESHNTATAPEAPPLYEAPPTYEATEHRQVAVLLVVAVK